MNYCDFGYWIAGVEIEEISHSSTHIMISTKDALTPDVAITSRSGHSQLVEVTGDVEDLINVRILGGYVGSIYYEGEWATNFIILSENGEVSFLWAGLVGAGDVEIRKC